METMESAVAAATVVAVFQIGLAKKTLSLVSMEKDVVTVASAESAKSIVIGIDETIGSVSWYVFIFVLNGSTVCEYAFGIILSIEPLETKFKDKYRYIITSV